LRPLPVLALLVALAAASGCAVNPATGERQLSLVSEGQEIQMGREADAEVSASLGLVADESWQTYVQSLGERMALASERPNLPWTFRVVDDPVVNAFALPGGFIYITRGILTHFSSEAELMGVLGHEIGHVTARHSVSQMSRAQLAQFGLGVGTILAPDLAPLAQAAGAGLGLLFLRYGREDERQADDLGLRYMTRENYDPREMAATFEMLANASGAREEGGRVPAFLSTHPDPLERRDRIIARIEAGQVAGTRVERESYLQRLEGMPFGEDPRQGYFEENVFLHPELAFRLDFPVGWQTLNGRDAVQGVSAEEDALVVLSLDDASTPGAARDAFLGGEGIRGGNLSNEAVNGLPAARADFLATTQDGTLTGAVVFILHDGRVYRILGYAPEARWSARSDAVRGALGSFQRVTDPQVLNAQADEIELVRTTSAWSLEEFNRRYPSVVPIETIATINHVELGEVIPSGTLVKRVVGDSP
jgi:predicted Zn-dependent protease